MTATVTPISDRLAAKPTDQDRSDINNRLAIIRKAVGILIAQGYTIVGYQDDTLMAKPAIYLMPEPRLARMAESGDAVYYRTGHGSDGPYRVGQFDVAGAAVKWIEKVDWSRA